MKKKIILAIIVGAVVFVCMSYFYNPKVNKKNNKKKDKKDKKKSWVFDDKRETTFLVSAIAALGTWFVVKTYFSDETTSDIVDIRNMNELNNTGLNIVPSLPSVEDDIVDINQAGGFAQSIQNGQNGQSPPTAPTLKNSPMNNPFVESTKSQSTGLGKSYNLIGSGLDIPRSAIPKVLVDYD